MRDVDVADRPVRPRQRSFADVWAVAVTGTVAVVIVLAVTSAWAGWATDRFGPPSDQLSVPGIAGAAVVAAVTAGWRSGRRGGPTFPRAAHVLHALHHGAGDGRSHRFVRRAVLATSRGGVVGLVVAIGTGDLAPGSSAAAWTAQITAGVAMCALVFSIAATVAGRDVPLDVVMQRATAMSVASVAVVHRDLRSIVRASEFGAGALPRTGPSPTIVSSPMLVRRWLWSHARRAPLGRVRHLLAVALTLVAAMATIAWPPAAVALVPALWWTAVLTVEPLAVELELSALTRTLVSTRRQVVARVAIASIACCVALLPATVLAATFLDDLLSTDGGGWQLAIVTGSSVLVGGACACAGSIRSVTGHTEDLLAELMAAQPEVYGLAVAASEATPFLLTAGALVPGALVVAETVETPQAYLCWALVVTLAASLWSYARVRRSLREGSPGWRARLGGRR